MDFQHSADDIKIYKNRTGFGLSDKRCVVVLAVIIGILAFIIGILIGRFATCQDDVTAPRAEGVFLSGVPLTLMKEADPSISSDLIDAMNAENVREYLMMLTEKPHLAGTEGNHELGRKLVAHWKSEGLDHATLAPYQVMLSYPNMSDLNYVELLDAQGNTVYKSNLTEPILTPEEDKPGVVPPFNAYSPPGDITSELVYVNYGRVEDHEYLETNTNISVAGKIVLARYGKIFRGDKVEQAELRGAKGVILFSDPADITSGDTDKVYPDDWWLPPSGAQRGSIYIGVGDPLTPGYPAIASAYRKKDPNEYMPGIPCHPIGYGIAVQLMRSMGGAEVPEGWRGKMNTTYTYGDGFKQPGWKARIFISTNTKIVDIYNAIGVIRGAVEPDRYVIVGNHRDAWVFGALDPSSGTAVMMEMSRVMGNLVKSGKWRPRRSIVFASWDAEEYGLVGSIEWVEHYVKTLGARAIAYLNVDIAVEGNFSMRALGTPLIYKSLYEAAKKVSNPNATEVAAGRTTVYDTWLHTFPWSDSNSEYPKVSLPGSGSDYAPFRDRIGIPCVDIRYTWNKNKLSLSAYPMYHSVYETFYLVDKIMDRGFKYHTAVGQVWVEMARQLSDSLILPFNVSDYARVITELSTKLMDNFGQMLEDKGIQTALLTGAISNFTDTVYEFEKSLTTINRNDPFVVRRVNDQLMDLDRAFIDPNGLPGRKYKHHLIFTESSINNYAGSSFPGLSDALTNIRNGHNMDAQWDVVMKHYSVLVFTFQSAASLLKDVSDFVYDY